MYKDVPIDAKPTRRSTMPAAAAPDAVDPRAAASTPELDVLGFDGFYLREMPRLVTMLTALTGQRVVAEELAQEAMLRAHVRWSRVSRYDSPAAWVRRAGINLAGNSSARRRTEARLVARLGTLPTTHEPASVDHEFWATVRRLPERQATAVVLHYLADRSVREVAAAMGCAEGTAKAHLHKGRANLARLLENPENTDGH